MQPSPAAIPAEPEISAPAAGFGSSVRRGMVWMLATAAWSRVASFLSQIVLGRMLSPEDYGIYAVAMSFGVFAMFIKDGGGRALLIQRGPSEYPRLAGSVTWLAMMFSVGGALVVAALAPLVAAQYGDKRYVPMMLLIALSIPMQTPGSILGAKLWMDLRVRPYCLILMVSAAIRYVGAIWLAWLGFGPLAWAWPLVVLAVFESVAAMIATRDSAWLSRPHPEVWREALRTGVWIMVMALAVVTLTQGSYLVVGRIAHTEVNGVYFFAFQIVYQIEAIIGVNLQDVLLPVLTRLNAEPERQRTAILRSLSALMFLAAPAGAGMALMFEPLERMLWHGKWDAAVAPVTVLALLMPARILYVVPSALLQAQGRFRRTAVTLAVVGVGSLAAAAIGAMSNDPVGVSVWVGGALAAGCLLFSLGALRVVGITVADYARAVLPEWATAMAVGALVFAADRSVLHTLPPLARFLCLGVLYAALFWVAARLLLPRQIAEAIHFIPGRLRGPVRRLLGLKAH